MSVQRVTMPNARPAVIVPNVSIVGGAAFPTLANLQARYRADLGVTIATGISQWLDQSGNANTLTQGGGALQPTLVASVINGQPVARFGGTQNLALGGPITLPAAYSILAVIRTTSVANTQTYAGDSALTLVGDNSGGINNGYGIGYGGVAGKQSLQEFNGAWQQASSTSTVNDGLAHMIGVTVANGAQTFYKDAAADGAAALVTNVGVNEWQNLGRGFSATDQFVGDVAEIVIYTRSLSAGEVSQLHAYFVARYGVT